MSEQLRDYVIKSQYLPTGSGWQKNVERVVDTTLQVAWARATEIATELDREYGDGHFWTVDVTNSEGGSYVQLFHGRLS